MMMSWIETFLITLGLTCVLVYWVWIYALKINNFSVIDAAWSAGFGLHAILFFGLSDGVSARKILFLLMIVFWSSRLAYFLYRRIKSHHPVEDTRYQKLRDGYGEAYKARFLKFFMLQAVSISFLTLPFIFVFANTQTPLGWFEYIGFILFVISWSGEAVADAQMNSFKSNPANKGKVCNIGLWRYSRHPNYFFESCIWFSFYAFMLGTEGLWWALYAPLTILILLLKVTGVPPSEEQSLKSRGDAYREYQKTTSVFVPWFPKRP